MWRSMSTFEDKGARRFEMISKCMALVMIFSLFNGVVQNRQRASELTFLNQGLEGTATGPLYTFEVRGVKRIVGRNEREGGRERKLCLRRGPVRAHVQGHVVSKGCE